VARGDEIERLQRRGTGLKPNVIGDIIPFGSVVTHSLLVMKVCEVNTIRLRGISAIINDEEKDALQDAHNGRGRFKGRCIVDISCSRL